MTLASQPFVYLLEQDTDMTKIIRSLCEKKSLQLLCFESGPALMAALKDQSPSCIISANDCPQGQALSLMKELNHNSQNIPVIILGDHNDVYSAVAAIKAGALDYIEKPVIYGRLAENLNQVINGKR